MARFKGHRTGSSETVKVRPSPWLLKTIRNYPTVNAAARFLGISFATLDSFIRNEYGISLNNAGQIIERTGRDYKDLFVHEKVKS